MRRKEWARYHVLVFSLLISTPGAPGFRAFAEAGRFFPTHHNARGSPTQARSWLMR